MAGEPAEWVVHRRGLQLMICSRGGIENLGLNGSVQRVISWYVPFLSSSFPQPGTNLTVLKTLADAVCRADTCCAVLLRTNPSLQPTLIPNDLEPAIPGVSVGNLSERLQPLTASSHLTSGLIYIYLRLRYLTQFLSAIPVPTLTSSSSSSPTTLDDSFFSDKIDFIERAILALLASESLAESKAAAFLTALLNASLVFVYEELREVPKWNNVSICLSQRIRSGLDLIELDNVARWCPDLLLWVLMLGMSGANPLEAGARAWFVREIMEVEELFEVKIPKGLKEISGMQYFELAEAAITQPSSRVESDFDGDVRDEGG
jgi:hypothetical protein